MATILKARYFPYCSFQKAKIIANSSYTWFNILHARDSVKIGYLWRVGDGSSIKVQIDPWLPDKGNPFISSSPNNNLANITVKDLIIKDVKCWNVPLIYLIFNDRDSNMILGIFLSQHKKEDLWQWGLERNGTYYVKSAYKLTFKHTCYSQHSFSNVLEEVMASLFFQK